MTLRPTHVMVFGNPKVGTKLMQAQPTAALDLPLRLTVFEDDRGRVWVGYRRPDTLVEEHGIKDSETIAAMARALEAIVAKAVNVYDY
jgi:uncharacterized protein (DUF302 family)